MQMTPLDHLRKAVEMCIRSHIEDLPKEVGENVKTITVVIAPSEETIFIEIECDPPYRQMIQTDAIDQCYVLNQLKLKPEVMFI